MFVTFRLVFDVACVLQVRRREQQLRRESQVTLYISLVFDVACVLQVRRREQQLRRESQVTLYRKYRTGDLPDIQIKFSYIIAPLQALAQVSVIVHDSNRNNSHRSGISTPGTGTGECHLSRQ